jgi:hypothetical protein
MKTTETVRSTLINLRDKESQRTLLQNLNYKMIQTKRNLYVADRCRVVDDAEYDRQHYSPETITFQVFQTLRSLIIM